MTGPMKVSSVWPEMPFMRGPKGAERLREWMATQREIRQRTAARRQRVLAHEWACKRLCLILGLSEARQWNGYVPAAKDTDGRPNRCQSRRALIALLHEVGAAEPGHDYQGALPLPEAGGE